MTTALERTGQDGRRQDVGAPRPDDDTGVGSRLRRSWFARDPAWPIVALLVGWPLWWALGFAEYASVLFMIPMLHRMYLWRARRTRVIRMPRGFGLWLLFLVCMIASTVALGQTAPGTLPGPSSTRLISWSVRALSYFSATVILLYAGNLTEKELPRRRLAWLLALVGVYAVVGGFLAIADPHFRFTSPLSSLAPASIQASSGGEIYTMLHPGFTQLDSFQGRPRVSVPFLYTNAWSNNLAILLPWALVAWRTRRPGKPSRLALAVLTLALIPTMLSYDRGLWLAIVLGLLYLAVRLARQGKATLLGGFIAATLIAGTIVLLSPLAGYISNRLNNGSSNDARTSLTVISVKEALSSPFIGYGDTRRAYGSSKSIAIGRTANCTRCSNRSAGSNGQVWLLLITTGIPGTIFYLAFFGYGAWQFRRDRTPYGMIGLYVLLIGFMFDAVYDAIGGTLIFTMLAFVLLWRNDKILRGEETPIDVPDSEPIRMVPGRRRQAPLTGSLLPVPTRPRMS